MRSSDSALHSVAVAFWESTVFFYNNGIRLALIGVVWFVASLPLLTIGPASIGVYRVVDQLRENGEVDHDRVLTRVRSRFIPALLLGVFPLLTTGIALNYVLVYAQTGELLMGTMGMITTYVTIYVVLVLIPTFVALARGMPTKEALRTGRAWTGKYPIRALLMGATTLGIFLLSAILTVALVLIYPGFVFAFHIHVIGDTIDSET